MRPGLLSTAIVGLLFCALGMLAGVVWFQGDGQAFLAERPRPVPPLMLPALAGGDGPGAERVRLDEALAQGGLLNVWASWCRPCAVEHPHLMKLAGQGVAIVGVAYADDPSDATKFLDERGNPFAFSLRDDAGYMDVQLGMVGVPTTYVIDAEGMIAGRVEGVFVPDRLPEDLRKELARLVQAAQLEAPPE